MHSSFEEYFRCILIEWLPIKANSETLKQIPIVHKAGKKPDKIFLNDLAEYRDKTVNDIIQDSITEHMKLKSFNNENDIRSWCSKIGINLDTLDEMNQVDSAVHRRHKIVHEADLEKDDKNEKRKLTQMKATDLLKWINAYKSLVNYIEAEIGQGEDVYE